MRGNSGVLAGSTALGVSASLSRLEGSSNRARQAEPSAPAGDGGPCLPRETIPPGKCPAAHRQLICRFPYLRPGAFPTGDDRRDSRNLQLLPRPHQLKLDTSYLGICSDDDPCACRSPMQVCFTTQRIDSNLMPSRTIYPELERHRRLLLVCRLSDLIYNLSHSLSYSIS